MEFGKYQEAEKKYDIGGGGGWMRLEEGNNRVRIVSEFEDYGEHWSKPHNQSFVCLGKDECVFCQKNREADEDVSPLRVRYLGWVIDREDGKVKLLRIGHSIFKQIGQLAVSDDYEFGVIPKFDITINREGTGLETSYSVLPARKDSPLTKEEQGVVDSVASSTPAEIIDRMKNKLYDKMEKEWGIDIYDIDDEIDVSEIPF